MKCLLCSCTNLSQVALPEQRDGTRCADCDLVSLRTAHWLAREHERERYLLHRNTRDDSDYVSFLYRLITPLTSLVSVPAKMLDFGSGPTPVLAELLRNRGYDVALFDQFFANDPSVLTAQYDAIFCCETAEHFREPLVEWQRMSNCLCQGGFLGVMTLMHDDVDLTNWWYARDPTHIAFYSLRTMDWIAREHKFDILYCDARVVIFRKM